MLFTRVRRTSCANPAQRRSIQSWTASSCPVGPGNSLSSFTNSNTNSTSERHHSYSAHAEHTAVVTQQQSQPTHRCRAFAGARVAVGPELPSDHARHAVGRNFVGSRNHLSTRIDLFADKKAYPQKDYFGSIALLTEGVSFRRRRNLVVFSPSH